ncbi:MAG: serine/threonine-protein kinase [Planctomycetes bacterium]|nr:serine/threonine-protein kinase [Planctomycetota bacterium]
MQPGEEPDVAEVVTRFFEQRRGGRRVSIDEVLHSFGDFPRVAELRRTALHTIALQAYSADGGDPPRPAAPGSPSASSDAAWCRDAAGLGPDVPRLDGYDIVDCAGQGGMGVVYEAYQQSTGRRVALKFMRADTSVAEATRRRFEREVELVARLNHPHIVSVLDSGVQQGRYFYVMEYVAGQPLDEAIPPGHGDVPQTLRLMETICTAVDYAHQRGVLHRDLKPSNILIGDDGQPHLLDFGLAKAIDPGAGGGLELTLSQPGELLGTLAYMSPEQSRGQFGQMSVRSDVYSLGAIAYELITGSLPCDIDGPLGEVLNRIANHEPPRLSLHRRGLSADLDAILLKALNKSPDDRYATAGELAADFRRHLANQSILARRAGLATRLARWVRRNRAVAAVCAIALFVVVGITAAAFLRIAAERDRAQREAEKGRQVTAYLQRMLATVDPQNARGHEVSMREVLDDAAQQIDSELAGMPEVEAAVRGTIGSTYVNLGLYEQAQPHLQTALRMRQELCPDDDIEVAHSLRDLAALRHAQGDFGAAERLYHEALVIYRAHADQQEAVNTTLTSLSLTLLAEKDPAAEQTARDALAARRQRWGDEHPLTARSMNALALILHRTGSNSTEAETLYRQALAVRRQLYGDDHPDIAVNIDNLAGVVANQGRYREAEALYRQSLAMRRKLLGDKHPEVAVSLHYLAWTLTQLNDYDQAEPLLHEALAIRQQALSEEHQDVGLTMALLARVHMARHDAAQAEPLLREYLRIRRRVLPPGHADLITPLALLSRVLIATDEYAEATPLLRECLEIRRKQLPAGHWQIASTESMLGRCLVAAEEYEEAETLLLGSHPVIETERGENDPLTHESLRRIVALYEGWNRPDRAAEYRALLPVPPASAPASAPHTMRSQTH